MMCDKSLVVFLLMIKDRLDFNIKKLEEELPSELEVKEKSALTGNMYFSFPILDDIKQFADDLEKYIEELKDV